MITEAIAAVAIVAIATLAVWLMRREAEQKARKVEEVFRGREPLGLDTFYNRYFREKGVSLRVVEGVRKILEEHLYADMSRLAAEDDFSKNLSFFWDYDSMADVEIICALEEYFAIKITDEEAERTHTVEDMVALVSSKTQAVGTPQL